MVIYLVRHGETDANKDEILQGRGQNHQLNEFGVRQCASLKQKLLPISFTACYTSPLLRTWSSAIILVGERVKIEEDSRLVERSLGEFEGMHRSNYDYRLYWDYSLNSNKDGVETIRDIFERCEKFLVDILNKHSDDDTVLIVTYSAVVRALHHLLLQSDLNGELYDFPIGNAYCQDYKIDRENLLKRYQK